MYNLCFLVLQLVTVTTAMLRLTISLVTVTTGLVMLIVRTLVTVTSTVAILIATTTTVQTASLFVVLKVILPILILKTSYLQTFNYSLSFPPSYVPPSYVIPIQFCHSDARRNPTSSSQPVIPTHPFPPSLSFPPNLSFRR